VITLSVSSSSECLKFFSEFLQISVDPSNAILLAVFDVHPLRKYIYLFFLSLRVRPSKFDALHVPVMHDEISRQIAICNDDYKFVTYPHSILHEFAVNNKVMIAIHFEWVPLGTVRKLHNDIHVLMKF